MFPGCHPCSCSPSLLRFDFEFARASPSSHSHALPVHALRQVDRGPGRRIISHFPAFLRMIGSWGCLITRKNAGIVAFAVLGTFSVVLSAFLGSLGLIFLLHRGLLGALGSFQGALGGFLGLPRCS